MADPKEVSISGTSVSDQAASKDSLGFDPYVIAIADFLTESETKPPLTLSVEGAWGSGKSSFMKQLEQEIYRKSEEKIRSKLREKRQEYVNKLRSPDIKFWEPLKKQWKESAKNLDKLRDEEFKPINFVKILINFLIYFSIPLIVFSFGLLVIIRILVNFWKIVETYKVVFPPKPRVIWFNAWRHDKADALWAAFALTFLEEISKQRNFLDILPPFWGAIQLFWFRFEKTFSSLLNLSRTIAQIALFLSAIALVFIFTFLKGYHSIIRLDARVNTVAENLGMVEAECIKANFSSEYNSVVSGFISESSSLAQLAKSTEKSSPKSSRLAGIANSNQEKSNLPIAVCPTKKSDESKPDELKPDESKPDAPDSFISSIQKWSFLGGIWGTGGFATLWLFQKLQKVIGSPKKELTEYLKSPKYDDQVSFIEKFHKDFKKIVDAYAGKGNKVYVFIDDLDRCEVPKSAELMQAINLMIANDPQLIFILGMDREKVAAGLAVKHKEVIPYLFSSVQAPSEQTQGNQDSLKGIEYGYTFIEKFVQLPFHVPRPAKEQFDQFVVSLSSSEQPQDSIWQAIWNLFWIGFQNIQRLIRWIRPEKQNQEKHPGDLEKAPTQPDGANASQQEIEKRLEKLKVKTGSDSPEINNILEMVAPALDWNPRRLKQFLNLFRLRAYIASATGLFDEIGESPALTLEQLGKFTAIGVKWPLLMVELTKDEQLLANLQKCVLNKQKYDGTTTYWGSEPKLLELLFDRAEKQPDYSLEHVNVQNLLQASPQLYPPLDRIPLKSEKGVDYHKLRS